MGTFMIRAETPADRAAVRAVVTSAFGRRDEADLVERLRADADVIISLAAEAEGEIIGHVMLSPMRAPFRALGLAPVSVVPARQGSGVGAALIAEAIRLARDAGYAAIFVLGDPGYYGRFGFDVAAARGFASVYAGDHFAVLAFEPLTAKNGAVDYAPAFAGL